MNTWKLTRGAFLGMFVNRCAISGIFGNSKGMHGTYIILATTNAILDDHENGGIRRDPCKYKLGSKSRNNNWQAGSRSHDSNRTLHVVSIMR
jgi:hypothetical protein